MMFGCYTIGTSGTKKVDPTPGEMSSARVKWFALPALWGAQFRSRSTHFEPEDAVPLARKNQNTAQKMIDAKKFQLYIHHSRKEVRRYGKEESR